MLTGEIKKIDPTIPVLICSGYSQPALKAGESGVLVDGYIDKPITFDKLARVVHEALADRKGLNPGAGVR